MSCDGRVARKAMASASSTARELAADTHVSSCLRCQAELARERRIHRMLANLRAQQVVPGSSLLEDILHALDDPSIVVSQHSSTRRAVCAVAAVAGTAAAGAAGALVLANRARTRRLAG